MAGYMAEPTYETNRGNKLIQTCIDTTLSRNTDGKITNWDVNREYNESDHNTITFKLNYTQETTKTERNSKHSLAKTNNPPFNTRKLSKKNTALISLGR